MSRVVCVGDVMVDVQARLDRELAPGSDTPAPITLSGGGSAANTAAWLVSTGCPATFVGRVGADPLGRSATEELARAGVDLAVTVDPDLTTGMCIVLVGPDGERSMIPSDGANAVGGVLPTLGLRDHLHLSGYALFRPLAGARAVGALSLARAAGCPVSVDAASAAPLRAFGPKKFLDAIGPALLFANRDEAAVLTGAADPRDAARLLGLRTGEAVVKQGSGGAVWSDGTALVTVDCAPVPVIDSTGAGDAFAAGVLAARLAGSDVAEALRAGHALAARAVARAGARP